MDLKILAVDDSPTMRRIIKNTLKRIGFRDVELAENGFQAMETLKKIPGINFIISDWNMPVMDGLTFIKTVRASSEFSKIPILMVTTKSVKEDIIAAMQAGVNNYVVKPFTPEVLKGKIEMVLNKLNN